ncbi:MAG: DegT/DnrJ/EryC1/StrS family aminotransferase [Candidatus Obscuribacterales bacterium]|nr:DegT/DnrJ/EryC1/StrS family aminotransferase [Candidatus Obscuribacterales bacterium]
MSRLSVGRPNVMNKALFMQRVEQILESKYLTNDGPFVKNLENQICSLFEVRHCVAVANATLGLEILLSALKIKGEVITPSFTFVATAHAIKRAGAEPVFCDVSLPSLCASRDLIEPKITARTSAILAVNLYGGLCDLQSLSELSAKHKLPLIYDSAHSLGTKWKGRWTGSFGDAEVFSLHGTKFINGFEGGLIVTNNGQLAQQCALLRNFCFTGYDQVSGIGTNAKLSEIHAAMALTNLEHIDELIAKNKEVYGCYKRLLPDEAQLMQYDCDVEPNYQYVVVMLPPHCRDEVQEAMLKRGVFARKYFYPGVHQFDCYRQNGLVLAVTEDVAQRALCLPTGQDITEHDVRFVCTTLTEAVEDVLRVRQ